MKVAETFATHLCAGISGHEDVNYLAKKESLVSPRILVCRHTIKSAEGGKTLHDRCARPGWQSGGTQELTCDVGWRSHAHPTSNHHFSHFNARRGRSSHVCLRNSRCGHTRSQCPRPDGGLSRVWHHYVSRLSRPTARWAAVNLPRPVPGGCFGSGRPLPQAFLTVEPVRWAQPDQQQQAQFFTHASFTTKPYHDLIA